jgi:hypothetical protein
MEVTARRYNRFVKDLTYQDGFLFSAKFPRKSKFNFGHPVAKLRQKEKEYDTKPLDYTIENQGISGYIAVLTGIEPPAFRP